MLLRRNAAIALVLAVAASLAGCAGGPAGTGSAVPTATSRAADENVALAQQYIRDGQYEVALGRLQHALTLDPRSANAHTMMGLLNERIGREQQAGVSYRRATELRPESGDMANNYGTWLCRNGQRSEGMGMFERALQDPFYRTPGIALANAGSCARQAGELDRADGYLRRALAEDPTNPRVLQDLAHIQYSRGDFLRARAFLQRRESSGEVGPELLELAARIEDSLGDASAANRYRSRLLSEFPEYRPSTPDS